mmetsp:Transcript_17678/g.41994  ORF Transcript_17678/g.41994 Transcript_17678/m.41994 type:complete len:314 (-) Transcript_17678:122-1063(-)
MPCIRAYLRQPRSTVEECRSTPPGSRHQCERRRGNAISCAPARLAARDEEKARRRLGEGRAYGSASSLIVVIVDVVVHAFGHHTFLLVAALETLRWRHEGETLVLVVAGGVRGVHHVHQVIDAPASIWLHLVLITGGRAVGDGAAGHERRVVSEGDVLRLGERLPRRGNIRLDGRDELVEARKLALRSDVAEQEEGELLAVEVGIDRVEQVRLGDRLRVLRLLERRREAHVDHGGVHGATQPRPRHIHSSRQRLECAAARGTAAFVSQHLHRAFGSQLRGLQVGSRYADFLAAAAIPSRHRAPEEAGLLEQRG